MKKIFVSGCYDILHAGHVQFFRDAKALGDHLTVCFASKEVLALAKKREPSLPDDNKKVLIESIRYVDEVVSSSDLDPVFDFKTHFERIRPAVLAVTEDDKNAERKKIFCKEHDVEFVIIPKNNFYTQVSTSSILASIKSRL